LAIDSSSSTHSICDVALFGAIHYSSIIQNLIISGYVKSAKNAAGFVASSALYTSNTAIYILNCINLATISGENATGIITTLYSMAEVRNCMNLGEIRASVNGAGGIVNLSYNNAVISGNINAGLVRGGTESGGIVATI